MSRRALAFGAIVAAAALGAVACVGSDSSSNGGSGSSGGASSGAGGGASSGASGSGGSSGGLPGIDGGGGAIDATSGCASGMSCGDGKCHDLASDDANCGACGHACGAGSWCKAGACVSGCPAGQVSCGGACVDPSTSAAHCGASGDCTGAGAGVACGSGTACVGGTCAALCGSSASATIVMCSGTCTDTAFDPNNCGGCGKACNATNALHTSCGDSQCGVVCAAGFGDCNGDPSDGCEEDLSSSALNCGGCGRACSAGGCTAGACAPDPEWANAPPPVGDSPDAAAYLVEHGGAVYDVNGNALDAGLGAIADAAIDASAHGADVDASACDLDGGTATANELPCTEAGACDDVVLDRATGLLWQRWPTGSASTLASAQCYCASLRLAGLSGWRLPTRLELLTLVDYARSMPAVNPGAFPEPVSGRVYFVTSSISKPVDPEPYTWEIDLGNGELFEWGAGGSSQRIRCVR